MKKCLILVCCILFSMTAFADSYTAKSSAGGDGCNVKATETTMNTADGKKVSGVLFKISNDDGDRLDVHCDNFVGKFSGAKEVFVVGMIGDNVKSCRFDEHKASAGQDSENDFKTSQHFVKD